MRKFITFFLTLICSTILFAQADADFDANIHYGFINQAISFTDQSNANPTAWQWDFENDGTVDAAIQNPTHTFTDPGVYVVSLTSSFVQGPITINDTHLDTIVVYEVKFTTNTANGDTVGAIPFVVQFVNTTFNDFANNRPPDPVSYEWDFGDGNTSTDENPVHTYDTGDYYDVSLKIKIDENMTVNTVLVEDELIKWDRNDPIVSYIRVYDVDFEKDILWGFAPQVVNFTDLSSPTPDEWHWDLDYQNGDLQIDSNDQDPQFTYNDPGPFYNILQAVYNHPDGPDTVTVYDSVSIFYADFYATQDTSDPNIRDTVGMVQFQVLFTDTPTWAPWIDQGLDSWLPPADLVTWDWDFGTGDFDTVENPIYTYTDCGFYDVELTIEIDPQLTVNQVLASQTRLKWDAADPDNWYIWVKGPITALVLDNSESMNFDNRAGDAQAAASGFINLLNPGYQISVTGFREWEELVFPVDLYSYDGTNSPLAGANSALAGFPTPDGYSTPGGGLREALYHTEANWDFAPASQRWEPVNNPLEIVDTIHVILLSDGLQNAAPLIDNTLINELGGQSYIGNVKVHTITMGTNNQNFALMQQVAQIFNGTYHDCTQDGINTILQDLSVAIGASAARIGRQEGNFSNVNNNARSNATHEIHVDSYAKDVTFVLSWDDENSDLYYELEAPDGTIVFTPTMIVENASQRSARNTNYTIKNPMPGTWRVHVYAETYRKYYNVNYELFAHAATPLTGKLSFDQTNFTPGTPINLKAALGDVHGEDYTLDNIVAEIFRPDHTTEYISLTPAGNGNFTAQYSNTADEGSYNVTIFVEGHNSEGQIRRSFGQSIALVNTNIRLADADDNVNDVEVFTARNYPNPFNPETTIEFSLPSEQKVTVDVYNIKGEKVTRLAEDMLFGSGVNAVKWNGKDSNNKAVGSGTYFYKVKTQTESITKKMILLK